MKLLFEVEEYEDMKGLPFELTTYYDFRLYLYIIDNGQKRELLNSTFHDGVLLDLGNHLITLNKGKRNQFELETYENALKYLFKKRQSLLFIDEFNHYDTNRQRLLECSFGDFSRAFALEYKNYLNHILKQDETAFDHESYIMMVNQLELLNQLNRIN